MKETFILDISYSQVAVFSPDLENPFNDWTQDQIDAGYSWQSKSVSFSADDDGPHEILLTVGAELPEKNTSSARSLEVIIDVSQCGQIEIASIADSREFPLLPGVYKLRFEYIPRSAASLPLIAFALKPRIFIVK